MRDWVFKEDRVDFQMEERVNLYPPGKHIVSNTVGRFVTEGMTGCGGC